jgi:hypothetical protein
MKDIYTRCRSFGFIQTSIGEQVANDVHRLQNLTLRISTQRFPCMTCAFSKKMESMVKTDGTN